MRLTLVTPGFAADATDDCIPALRELVRALAARHRVDVLALRYPVPARDYDLGGARVTALGGGEAFGVRRGLLLARAARWLERRARAGEIDVVHALWADEPGWLAIELERRTGVPALVSLMGGELARLPEIVYGHQLHRVPRWLVSGSLRRASALTVGSLWLRDRLVELEGERPHAAGAALEDRVRVAPLGIDAARFDAVGVAAAPRLEPRGRPTLLSVGSLAPVKGHAQLLRAFSRALPRIPDACLHLVGEGPLRGALEASAAQLGVASRVRFHGARPQAELPGLYRSADLCVLASHWESQSLVAVEAAACGRVTIGSALGALPELAPTDALTLAGDVEALANLLARVGSLPEVWRPWGELARERALARFELGACVARFETAYAEVAARDLPGVRAGAR